MKDGIKLRGHLLIEKFDENMQFVGKEEADNLFVTVGLNEIWNLVTGQSANVFDNTHATIGIGDSSTAAGIGDTDLKAATNKTYKAMDSSYPNTPSGGAVAFKSTFSTGDANYAWNEFVVKQSTSAIIIDRATGTWGTKASGTTWVATVTLTIA
jgi:hypothetical protein